MLPDNLTDKRMAVSLTNLPTNRKTLTASQTDKSLDPYTVLTIYLQQANRPMTILLDLCLAAPRT